MEADQNTTIYITFGERKSGMINVVIEPGCSLLDGNRKRYDKMKNGREQQYNNNTPRNYMIEMPDVRIGSHVAS